MDESIDLKKVLRLHELWINGYKDGRRKEYEAAIAFFKTVAEANEENAQNG